MELETIGKLFESRGLGKVVSPFSPVSGGFMHRIFRVETARGTYAVKHLNPEIMKRPEAMENYRRAEKLEKILENAGIPIVPAIAFSGRKMQEMDGEYFYIFRWHAGRVTDWRSITAEQCALAGNILGRIHAVLPGRRTGMKPHLSRIDWTSLAALAEKQGSTIAPLLKENTCLLRYAQNAVNKARLALPDIECITDEDMDPKNVMWEDGKPVVIDLECLDYGNPVSGVLQLSLQWSGLTTCSLDPDKQKAFFDGYLEAYDNGFRDYGSVFGLSYTWIEWLEFNIRRALGQCRDETEQETGINEVRSTLKRIRCLRENEDMILCLLTRGIFPG